jgi:transcriptional regulator GlxA family with amidase domain
MRIAILNYQHAVPTCVTGPAEIWNALAQTLPGMQGVALKSPVTIDYVGANGKQLWRKIPETTEEQPLGAIDVYDLIIVPAMRSARIAGVLAAERTLVEWLQEQHRQKAALASICIGAFLLAETGLLSGKNATTNIRFAAQFRLRYPDVEVRDDKIIVDQGNILTCGGAFIFTTFMIYLIEKYYGHEEAIMVAKLLMINTHELPQHTFSIFRLQRDHADERIGEAQTFIEQNYSGNLSVERLAGRYYMSPRNFIRRFEAATGNTPLEYLQRVRIEAAKKLLENSNDSMEHIALKCGYEDIGFFRKVFKRHAAVNPKEYQKKYGRTGLSENAYI